MATSDAKTSIEQLLESARASRLGARDELARALLPIVQRRVARALSRCAKNASVTRQEVLDLTQDAMLRLFAHDMRVLTTWDRARGVPLASYVGVVAERVVYSTKRSGRRGAWREDLSSDGLLDETASDENLEDHVANREILQQLLDRLRAELSPRAMSLFRVLYVEHAALDVVARQQGMTMNALYTWRSRLRATLLSWQRELEGAASTRSEEPPRAEVSHE